MTKLISILLIVVALSNLQGLENDSNALLGDSSANLKADSTPTNPTIYAKK